MTEVELTISTDARPPQPSGARLAGTLTFAAAISGLILASVFQYTEPFIKANKARALEKAISEVIPGTVHIERLVRDGDVLHAADESTPDNAPVVHAAFDADGALLGFAVAHSGAGFQDTVRLIYGYNPGTQQLTGMRVLDSRETPGLGDRIWKDEAWVSSFRELSVEVPLVVVKDGRDAPNEVDAITGATISSVAVISIINAAHVEWADVLGDDAPERVFVPPPPEPEPAASPSSPEPEAAP